MLTLALPLFQNVVVVLTAVEGDTCHKSLTRLKAEVLTVGALDMFDKAEVVRQTLAAHRKALDETPFNNQVSQSDELFFTGLEEFDWGGGGGGVCVRAPPRL